MRAVPGRFGGSGFLGAGAAFEPRVFARGVGTIARGWLRELRARSAESALEANNRCPTDMLLAHPNRSGESPMPTRLLASLLCLIAAAFTPPPGPPAATGARVEPEAVPPLVLAFYYPWYGTPAGPGGRAHGGRFIHWEGVNADKKLIESSTHYPTHGAYDSHDPGVVRRHVQEAKGACIDAFIVSWWGKGTFEDGAMRPILDGCAAGGVKACIYYEQVAKPGTPESVAAEFAGFLKRYGGDPAYLKVTRGGRERPVVFIYGRALRQLGLKKWKVAAGLIADADGPDPLLIADDFGDEALSIFDGAHSYAPMGDLHGALAKGETLQHWIDRAMPWWANHPRDKGKISTITVFPGYDDTKIRHPGMKVDRDGGRLYQTLWRAAADAGPDWVLITSFNEWHEGSEIEPSVEYGDRYLKLTAEGAAAFKAARGGAGPSAGSGTESGRRRDAR